tara:strand:- start:604 stop:858 length:255 start_codon:yes stop_codon:yes gene_type:complete
METKGVWEYIYLSCLEIDKESDKAEIELEKLVLHLSTIRESLPADIDPVEDFEAFVLARLCFSISHFLDNYLSESTTKDIPEFT